MGNTEQLDLTDSPLDKEVPEAVMLCPSGHCWRSTAGNAGGLAWVEPPSAAVPSLMS